VRIVDRSCLIDGVASRYLLVVICLKKCDYFLLWLTALLIRLARVLGLLLSSVLSSATGALNFFIARRMSFMVRRVNLALVVLSYRF